MVWWFAQCVRVMDMSRIQTANAAQNVEGVVLLRDKRDLTVRKIVISSYRFEDSPGPKNLSHKFKPM